MVHPLPVNVVMKNKNLLPDRFSGFHIEAILDHLQRAITLDIT
jgi:hypothetical protein